MRSICIRATDTLFTEVKLRLVETDETMQNYIIRLIETDIANKNPDKVLSYKVQQEINDICSRLVNVRDSLQNKDTVNEHDTMK